MTVAASAASTPAGPTSAARGEPPTTVGAYLRDLPPDRRVAMARVCSMIRRSARGVRESMRYGLAFYELDGPLFALESGRRHMSLYVAEQEVVIKYKDALSGVDTKRSFIKFLDLNRLPLDVVEKIVRDSVTARRVRVAAKTVPTQAELLKLWSIKEEAATPPPPRQTISLKPTLPPPPPPGPPPVMAVSLVTGRPVKTAPKIPGGKAVKPVPPISSAVVAKTAKTAAKKTTSKR